jgi:hypothetical protein
MAAKGAKVGMAVFALILVGGIGYFIYSNSSTSSNDVAITIGAGSSYFTPTIVTVNLDQTVTMVVFNADNNPHVFSIKAFNATTGVIQPGKTGRATFVANQTGVFPFYSPLSSTDAQGMADLNGTLVVRG